MHNDFTFHASRIIGYFCKSGNDFYYRSSFNYQSTGGVSLLDDSKTIEPAEKRVQFESDYVWLEYIGLEAVFNTCRELVYV